jgi:hypothetical protein
MYAKYFKTDIERAKNGVLTSIASKNVQNKVLINYKKN